MKLHTKLALAAVLSLPAVATAGSEQLLFVGHRSPIRELRGFGAAQGVFLSWDAVEGKVPADVLRLRLRRGATVLAEFDPHSAADAVLPAAAIQGPTGFYDAACTTWRCREQARNLCEIAAAEARGPNDVPRTCTPAEVAAVRPNVGVVMHDRLTRLMTALPLEQKTLGPTRAWARIAARQDVGVALAARRAFIDTGAPAGPVTYTLEGVVDLTGAVAPVRLGEIVVSADPMVVGPADALRQIPPSEFSRCDSPEAGLGHGTVALSWDHPGASAGRASRYLAELTVAGYDLFRRTGACGALAVVPQRDPVSGAPRLAGFERVNGAPIMISPNGVGEGPFRNVQYLEDIKSLAEDGIDPGDQLCYVAVARDVTGGFGAPASVDVTVPSLLPPPAPWNLQVVAIPGGEVDDVTETVFRKDEHLALSWDAVDVPNYVRHLGGGVALCNAASAMADAKVRAAQTPGECSGDAATTVPLDVEGYLLYAFDSARDASAFDDPDGDGWANTFDISMADAATPVSVDPDRCLPDPAPPVATPGYFAPQLIPASAATRAADGRVLFSIEHPVGAADKGQERWYRIAAIARGGLVRSTLSPPVRAVFPDDTKPPRPQPADFTYGVCGEGMTLDAFDVDGPHAIDLTGRATALRLVCPGPAPIDWARTSKSKIPGRLVLTDGTVIDPVFGEIPLRNTDPLADYLSRSGDRLIDEFPIEEHPEYGRVAFVSRERCTEQTLRRLVERAQQEESCWPEAQFVDERGEILAQQPLTRELRAALFEGMCVFQATLAPSCEQGFVRPIDQGMVVNRPPRLVLSGMPIGACADVMEDIDGTLNRVARRCRPTVAVPEPVDFEEPNLGGGQTCRQLVYKSKNNVVSTPLALPCYEKQPPSVAPPFLADLTFLPTGEARLAWRRPPQRVAGIMIELFRRSPSLFLTDFAVANNALGPAENQSIDLTGLGAMPPVGTTETWCVRARAVGVAVGGSGQILSAQTQLLCRERSLEPPPPVAYLPWPAIPHPTDLGGALKARYLADDGVVALLIGSLPDALMGSALDANGSSCTTDLDCKGTTGWPNLSCNVSGDCVPTGQFLGDTCAVDGSCGAGESCYSGLCVPTDCASGGPCLDRRALYFRSGHACGIVSQALGTPGRFVVYRQHWHAGEAKPEEVAQVSPRIDGMRCAAEPLSPKEGFPTFVNRYCAREGGKPCTVLDDPFLRVAHFNADAQGWPTFGLVYVDEAPYAAGDKLRYQLVYFDARGEIAGTRTTDWVETLP
jgi:hypothetical protein